MVNLNLDKKANYDRGKGWLHQRLKQEDSNINPSFSLHGTVNWMRGLAILVEDAPFSPEELSAKYQGVERRNPPMPKNDTFVFQFTFMSFQNLSALCVMLRAEHPSDLVRSAIIAWYYGLYYSTSAMLAAADGSVQEDHRGTAKAWDR